MRYKILIVVRGVFFWRGISATPAQVSCGETVGRTERARYYAQSVQTEMFYTVYLPPCYDAEERVYPVIYLLHGSDEDDNQWLRLGLADVLDRGILRGEFPPLIAVLPFGNWVANENDFGEGSWGDIFLHQLMPLVESEYRIDTSPGHRAIGGISRGGFWAFHIALLNPSLFSAVGGHSAFFDLYHAPDEYNPLDLASTAPGIDSLRIWLDRGAEDYAGEGLDLMHARLVARGVPHVYIVYPEGT